MKRLLMAAALAAGASGAHAQLIVANDQSTAPGIYHIDVNTGVSSLLYSGSDAQAWGLAYDGGSNTLYWNEGATLYSSPFSMGGLTPTNHGTMTFNGATSSFVSLGFHNGQLLATKNISTEAVYSVNTSTLESTQLYVYSSSFDFGGLDSDPTTGRLFGLSDSAPAGAVRGLYEIDLASQMTSFIAGYPAGETDIDGLGVYNGLAYFVSDGPNTTQANFYIYDIETGQQVGTLPSPFAGSGIFSAATVVPAPGAAAMLLIAGGLASRRRR